MQRITGGSLAPMFSCWLFLVLLCHVQMEKMDKSLESVKRSFATVRTGRANPAMLDRIEARAARLATAATAARSDCMQFE
jgi:hypothetical protein